MTAAAAKVHSASAKMHPSTAAEMHAAATPAEVGSTATEVPAPAASAGCLRGQWRREGHHGRKQDGTNSNAVACHNYLPGVM